MEARINTRAMLAERRAERMSPLRCSERAFKANIKAGIPKRKLNRHRVIKDYAQKENSLAMSGNDKIREAVTKAPRNIYMRTMTTRAVVLGAAGCASDSSALKSTSSTRSLRARKDNTDEIHMYQKQMVVLNKNSSAKEGRYTRPDSHFSEKDVAGMQYPKR